MGTSVSSNPFAPLLAADAVVVLDGGLATALEERGHRLDSGLWSARVLVDAPDSIRAVHRAYLKAGADCITTSSYQASFAGFTAAGHDDAEAVEMFRRSSDLAVAERDAVAAGTRDADAARSRPLVAASVGPYGAHLADGSEYDGRYGVPPSELERFHRRRFELLASTGVDLIACETIPSAVEARVLLDILGDVPHAWAWMSFSCRDGSRLSDGTPIDEVVASVDASERVAAVGVNCTAPRYVADLIGRARPATDLPLIAYPNSGERYDARTGRWSPPPSSGPAGDLRAASPSGRLRRPEARGEAVGPWDDWLAGVLAAIAAGASIVGGCCRVGPDAIAELRRVVDNRV